MTRLEMAQALRAHDNYIILTHRRPDGDTLGSAAGLCLGLRALGKNAWVLKNRQLTPKLAPLQRGSSRIRARNTRRSFPWTSRLWAF